MSHPRSAWPRRVPASADRRRRARGTIGRLLALLSMLAAGSAFADAETPKPAPEERAIDVLHYAARLDPDLSGKRLRGHVAIRLVIKTAGTDTLDFDAGALTVDAVRERGAALAFEKVDKRLRIRLPRPARVGARHMIEIDYHGAPTFGLEFHPERGELYTIFSTSQWLVCIDAPDERATLDLSVALPAGLTAVGNGRPASSKRLDDGRELHRWRQREPVPSFTYGFAAGRYAEVVTRDRGVALRYLSTDLPPEQLRRVFADTGDMLRFFGERAGVRYRGGYAQALVTSTVGQEMAGLALLSEAYGRDVLDDATAESLIAHEAAHQWWGIRITCRDWNHFWLNEGFANFMAAAYLQHRFGEVEYRKQVDGWKRRLDKLRADGADRALVYERWFKPTANDRAVVYQKGAYALHLLREELGERAFWNGIRAYTRGNLGQSVTTPDLRRAMERSSGRDLAAFFARWVDGPGEPAPAAAAMPAPQTQIAQ